jgi:alpha-tubulin suppressor-like RCC1 family protein
MNRSVQGVVLGSLVAVGAAACGPSGWVELRAGGTRTCARAEDGEVVCWGGRLVTGGQVPTLLGSSTPKATPPVSGATALCLGASFACARVVGGKVSCLAPEPDARWTEVTGLNGITTLACGDGGGCALSSGGELSCWSWTSTGPGALERVEGLPDAQALAVGLQHRCAVREDQTLWCWGRNGAGQLGVSPQATADSEAPVQAQGLAGVTAAAAGRDFTCALGTDRKVRCFGSNLVGQLGYPGGSSLAPVEVVDVQDAVAIAAGEYHACALLGAGAVRCWGRNLNGQLGDRTREDRKASVEVQGLQGATGVSTGTAHSCAQVGPEEVYCWGQNNAGQLGDGTFEDRAEVVAVDTSES